MRLRADTCVPMLAAALCGTSWRIGAACCIALIAFLATASQALAQTVNGRLLDGQGRRPILLAVVTLMDTAHVLVDRTYTDDQGRFELAAPRGGSYLVAAARDGYQPKVDGVLDLPAGSTATITFYLQPLAIRLDSITAQAGSTASTRYLNAQGFYRRQRLGFGHFVSPEALNRRVVMNVGDLLQGIPGVYVNSDVRGSIVRFRDLSGQQNGYCVPRIFVDGAAVSSAGAGGNVVIEDFVDPVDLDAVEVYTRIAAVPLEFGALTNCGVLLFWTRRGR
jgi:hypothetical protein